MKYFVAILTFIVVFSFWCGMCLLQHYTGHGGFVAGKELAKTVLAVQYWGLLFGCGSAVAVVLCWPSKK